MTRDEAISFLRQHQPLPDVSFDQELHTALHETFKFFKDNPDPDREALPLLVNVFGDGSAGGIYQVFDDLLAKYDKEDVVRELRKALSSKHRSVRCWNAQMAARFPDERLTQPLADLLKEDEFDMRYGAITALEQIGSPAAKRELKEALLRETDVELRALLEDVLK
jgi:HEAT repeat protein